jgi:hypothetical protein
MATPERIRDLMHSQPFQPFHVKLVDGTVFPIKHPDFISVPPFRHAREITIYSGEGTGSGDDYRTHWINSLLILEVSVISEEGTVPDPADGNGPGA